MCPQDGVHSKRKDYYAEYGSGGQHDYQAGDGYGKEQIDGIDGSQINEDIENEEFRVDEDDEMYEGNFEERRPGFLHRADCTACGKLG
jgi:hypothetical protein